MFNRGRGGFTGNKEPSRCARHAESIPSEARIAACIGLAHVGEPQSSIWGKRDPAGVGKQRQQFYNPASKNKESFSHWLNSCFWICLHDHGNLAAKQCVCVRAVNIDQSE